MHFERNIGSKRKNGAFTALCAILAVVMITPCTAAFAGGPIAMAPPVAHVYAGVPGNEDTVFSWNEVPVDQQVPIRRACFDRGGYQLYDSVGETIVVPFTHNDLYVMKFCVSPNDTMYFENTGSAPILYCPRNGYLVNAGVSGARWYPFSEHFHPVTPVYEGCAPSWTAYVDEGWYPDTYCYGGYYCSRPYWEGGVFLSVIGLFFLIGDHHCYGWHNYAVFCDGHPWFHHTGWFHPVVYSWAPRSSGWRGRFDGSVHDMRARGMTVRGFNGAGRTFMGASPYRGGHWTGGSVAGARGGRAFGGKVAAARGGHGVAGARAANAAHRNFGRVANAGHRNFGRVASAGHRNSGGARAASAGHRNFGRTRVANAGRRSFAGARGSGRAARSFGGARRTFSAHHVTAGSRGFGGRSFGGRSFGGARSFGGRSSGGGRSFGGFHGGGARAFGGGGGGFRGGGFRGGGGGGHAMSGGGGHGGGGFAGRAGGGGGGRGGGGRRH